MSGTPVRFLVLALAALAPATSAFACSQADRWAGPSACKTDCGKPPIAGIVGSPGAGTGVAALMDGGIDAAVQVDGGHRRRARRAVVHVRRQLLGRGHDQRRHLRRRHLDGGVRRHAGHARHDPWRRDGLELVLRP
jgi:hypothetical protein